MRIRRLHIGRPTSESRAEGATNVWYSVPQSASQKDEEPRSYLTRSMLVQDMMPAVQTFHNVTSLDIDLAHQSSLSPEVSSFLRQCYHVSGSKLRSLSLGGILNVLKDSLPDGRGLPVLEQLDLQLYLPLFSVTGERQAFSIPALVKTLSTFVTEVSSTLQRLSVWCKDPIDLSDFFASLHSLPELRSLTIIFPNSKWCLSDNSPLTRILVDHRNMLKNFELKEGRMLNPVQWSFTSGMINFSLEIQAQNAFPTALETCSLYLCAGHYHHLPEQVNGWLSKDLTSLRLSGTLLSYDDCVRLFNSIREGAPALTLLCFHIFGLSPLIFDLLAADLPRLETLRIKYVHLLVAQYGDPNTGRVSPSACPP